VPCLTWLWDLSDCYVKHWYCCCCCHACADNNGSTVVGGFGCHYKWWWWYCKEVKPFGILRGKREMAAPEAYSGFYSTCFSSSEVFVVSDSTLDFWSLHFMVVVQYIGSHRQTSDRLHQLFRICFIWNMSREIGLTQTFVLHVPGMLMIFLKGIPLRCCIVRTVWRLMLVEQVQQHLKGPKQ
jgi:hypothetical protein